MAPVTELATIPLHAGAIIEDPNSPSGKIWQSTLDTISAQAGFQKAYFGRKVEDQSVVQLFVDWDSLESHQDSRTSPVYGPFAQHLMTIVDGDISMYHATFDPHPPSAALSTNNPVTEILTSYFTSKNDSYQENFRKFVDVLRNLDGFRAASTGWVIEDVQHEKIGSERKGKAFVGALGWNSVEAHTKAKETDAFKNNIHLLREGPVALEMHHTAFDEH